MAEKYIFVAAVSLLQGMKGKSTYKVDNNVCELPEVEGIQTNEAALKCFLKYTEGKERYIIFICSEKVMTQCISVRSGDNSEAASWVSERGATTYQYLTEYVLQGTDVKGIIAVPTYNDCGLLEKGTLIGNINKEIEKISEESAIKIWLDTTGSQRDNSVLIQLLTKLLEYKGIETTSLFSYWTSDEKEDNKVFRCDDFWLHMKMLDGVNEFVTSGRTDQLCECLDEIKGVQLIKDLSDQLKIISKNFRLCMVDNIDAELKTMFDTLEKIETAKETEIPRGDILTGLLYLTIPLIRESFYGGSNITVPQIIKWCTENGMLQQALTLYTELIPRYIMVKGYVRLSKDKEEKEKAKVPSYAKQHPEPHYFYEVFMSEYNGKMLIGELKRALDNAYMRNMSVIKKCFPRIWKMLVNIQNFYQNGKNDCFLDEDSNDLLREFPALKNTSDFDKFLAAFKGNNKALEFCILESLPTNKYFYKFISAEYAAKNAEAHKTEGDFTIGDIDGETLSRIMYSYIYVKYVRNQLNHANNKSDTENEEIDEFALNDEQLKCLEEKGYTTPGIIDFDSIKKNLLHALELFNNL